MRQPKLTLTIEKAIYGGAGLARVPADGAARGGKTVFIPMTLPGEIVEVEIQTEKKQFANATLLRVIQPSPARIEPPCQHYGICGGCDYQHATVESQLEIKRSILQESLDRAGIRKLQSELPAIQLHTAAPWEYRNRIRLHVTLLEGRVRLGYTRAHTNQIVPIRECPISSPLLMRAAFALESAAYEDLAVLDLLSSTAEVELLCTADESALQITLSARDENSTNPKLDALQKSLRETLPQLRSLAWRGNSNADGINYLLGTEDYRIPHGAFFQANRHLLPELLACVTTSRSGSSAWDLYSGVGLFARALAGKYSSVTAVESSLASLPALRHNLAGTSADCSIHHAETNSFLKQAQLRRIPAPEFVVLDPPRAGLGPDVCRALAAIAPPEIAYVSCDPPTLARDMATLIADGYRCTQLHLFDMFPQTSHIEAIALLKK